MLHLHTTHSPNREAVMLFRVLFSRMKISVAVSHENRHSLEVKLNVTLNLSRDYEIHFVFSLRHVRVHCRFCNLFTNEQQSTL